MTIASEMAKIGRVMKKRSMAYDFGRKTLSPSCSF